MSDASAVADLPLGLVGAVIRVSATGLDTQRVTGWALVSAMVGDLMMAMATLKSLKSNKKPSISIQDVEGQKRNTRRLYAIPQ